MRYRDVITPGGGLDGLPGFHVKSEKYPHSTHFLKWEEGVTTFRAYPAVENGEILGIRYSEQPGDFTPWFVAVRMVKMFGVNDKFTCLTHVKGKPYSARGPIDYFADTMEKTVGKNAPNYRDFPQEWEGWMKSAKNKGAKISPASNFGLMQGMLFENGKKTYVKDGRPNPLHPIVLCLAKSAQWQLSKLGDAEVEGYRDNPEDWSRRFKLGDVVSPDVGRLLQFYTIPSSDESNARYGVRTLDPVQISPELIKNEWCPWEQLLVFLSEEEQMELLLRSFPSPPLDFVFSGSTWEDLLPAKVKGAYKPNQQSAQGYQVPFDTHPVSAYQFYGQPQQAPAYMPPQQPVLAQAPAYAPPQQQPVLAQTTAHMAPQQSQQPPQQQFQQPPQQPPQQQFQQPPQQQFQQPPPQQFQQPLEPQAQQQMGAYVPPPPPPSSRPEVQVQQRVGDYVPPPPPPGYGAQQAPSQPQGSPYANLSFGVTKQGQGAEFQPLRSPQQPPTQPTGDPSAASGLYMNAMEDLRAAQASVRQRGNSNG